MNTLERYNKRKTETPRILSEKTIVTKKKVGYWSSKKKNTKLDIDLVKLPSNHGLRTSISEYDPNIRNQVRHAYI